MKELVQQLKDFVNEEDSADSLVEEIATYCDVHGIDLAESESDDLEEMLQDWVENGEDLAGDEKVQLESFIRRIGHAIGRARRAIKHAGREFRTGYRAGKSGVAYRQAMAKRRTAARKRFRKAGKPHKMKRPHRPKRPKRPKRPRRPKKPRRPKMYKTRPKRKKRPKRR